MEKINSKFSVLIVLLVMIFLSGCDVNEIEKTQFPFYIAVDTNENRDNSNEGAYRISLQFPIFDKRAPKKVNNLASIADSVQTALNRIQGRTLGYVSVGLLRSMIFSEKIAKNGLFPHIDAVWRNPKVAGSIVLTVSEGEAEKIREVKIASTENNGLYLESLLDSSARNGLYPKVTLNQFYIDLKTNGIEPYLPLIRYGATDIEIIGAAIFKGDKMVSKIKMPELRALLFLRKQAYAGDLSLKIDDYIVDYYFQNVNFKIEPIFKNGHFVINITGEAIIADMKENTSDKRIIENNDALTNMARHLSAELDKEIKDLFKILQENKSDVIGIGRLVKVKYPDRYDKKNWYKYFEEAEINTEIKVIIRRLGIST